MEHFQTITPQEWHAYVAGFFDGEGAIGLSMVRSPLYSDAYRLRVEIAQRIEYRAILDRIASEFGGRVVIRHQSKKSIRWSDIAIWWALKRESVRGFLESMLPYLYVKRERAELAIGYLTLVESQLRQSTRTQTGARWAGSLKLTPESLAQREEFRQRMLWLNRFGPRTVHAIK